MSKGTVNKVIVLGRLGQDPDVRSTANGTQVVNLNVATNERGPKQPDGSYQDATEWHKIVLFGKTAEIAAQYLSKGSQVYIEGRLQTRKWQDQSGADRYSTEIVGNEMQFIGGKSDNQSQGAPQPNGIIPPKPQQAPRGFPSQQPAGSNFNQPPPQQQPPKGFDDFDDDIPFNNVPSN